MEGAAAAATRETQAKEGATAKRKVASARRAADQRLPTPPASRNAPQTRTEVALPMKAAMAAHSNTKPSNDIIRAPFSALRSAAAAGPAALRPPAPRRRRRRRGQSPRAPRG